MALGHEKLDVYRLAIGYVAWVFERYEKLNRKSPQAMGSIPISIAISIPRKSIPNQTFWGRKVVRF